MLRGIEEGLRAAMGGGIIRGAVLPAAPEHAHPGAGKDADRVRVIAAARAGAAVDISPPGRAVPRVVGEADHRLAQALVAGPAEAHAAVLAGRVGDRRGAGFGGQLLLAAK